MSRRSEVPNRRKRLVRVGAIAAVLLVVVGVPVALTMQPSFFGRVPALAAEYKPWSTSAHAEVGCDGCHVPPRALHRVAYRARMVGEFYLSLALRARKPSVFSTPSNDACLQCHNDLRSVSPKGDLQIPHRAHVTILKMDCVQCHDYLVHALNPAGKHLPTMAGCMKCHDGDTAKDTCTACHTRKAAPESHQASDWLVVHPKDAAGPQCDSCHKWTEDWCADCHALRPRSHGDDWRAAHGDQVKKRRNCESCHDTTFCVPCHGEVPQENFDPAQEPVK